MSWREEIRVPAWCPLCERLMKGSKSNSTYYNWNCCSDCHLAFVEDREERWKTGWRPDEKTVKSYYNKLDRKK